MIMQGKTPRSLTWPGCLAVVALGLMLLPMMPSLHGETPSREDARRQVREAEKALEKAKEALERQKAEQNKTVKESAQAEQRRVTEPARKALDRQRTVNHPTWMRVEDTTKAAYCIEIKLSAGASEKPSDVNDIVEKIRGVLPEELRKGVVVRPVPVYKTIVIGQNGPPASPRAGLQRAVAPPQQPSTPRPAAYSPPAVSITSPNVPVSKSSEKRISDLEKKLEKVLDELHELRKQMKRQ